jgi:ABC-type nitrate/sulfonate/bicarbonate transport system substrate-binding protein
VSTAHYATIAYLKALGLKESDVKIVHMEQAQAVAAFEAGQGDILAVWAPFGYQAEGKGWFKISSGRRVGAVITTVCVASKKLAEEHPEVVAKWLKLYMRGVREMKTNPRGCKEVLKAFNKEHGIELSDRAIRQDIELRGWFDTREQLALFAKDSASGRSKIEQWYSDLTDYFVSQGRITPDERDRFLRSGFITDRFLKMVSETEAKESK